MSTRETSVYETIAVTVGEGEDAGVATVTLDRPAKRNAMSPALHREMTDALERLRYDPAVRVVVITGAGEAFCAGMDLKEFFAELAGDPAGQDRVQRLAGEWRGRTLRHYPKPTIAMVNGYCFGGAFSIVEGADLAVAASEAVFGLSEVNFRMLPGGPVSWSMSRLLSPRDALLYALTGRPFDGAEAARIGLVNEAVPAAELAAHTYALARELAAKDPYALRATKNAYRHATESTYDASLAMTSALQSELTLLQGGAWRTEGVGDFLDGRYRPGLEGHETVEGN